MLARVWPTKAEAEVRIAQTEFDRQVEVTRLLLEGISSTHVRLLTYLFFILIMNVIHVVVHKTSIKIMKSPYYG